MKKIMILGASILQLPAIQKAKQMGFEVVAVDMDPNAIGFKEDNIIKEVISTIDIPRVVETALKYQIDGVMTLASDMPIKTVAAVSKELGLVGISKETAYKATNKYAMREALSAHRVPIPIYYKISNEEELFTAVQKIYERGYKCIVKPADNSGSRGIYFFSDYSTSSLHEAFIYSKQFSSEGILVVEEYMEGPEVSVETLSINKICHVIQITDKLTTGVPYFVEMGHNQPSLLSKSIQTKIVQIAIAANKAIGIENGPSHTEVKITKDGPKIVELGARLGGDNITTHLVPLSNGVDLVECCIKIAMGEKPDISPKFKKASAIRYFKTKVGLIKKIEGIEDAKKIEGINQVSVVHGVGDEAKPIRSSSDRIGFVIAQANTVKQALEKCERALKLIHIEIYKN